MTKLMAMFPGQGSQYVGMAKDLHERSTQARETFQEASDAIGVDLARLCFDGPEDELKLTANTQPCILTASIAAWRALQSEAPFVPFVFAGHSLGEYSALVAAGKLAFPRAVRLVRERGLAMQSAVPEGVGAMAAVMNASVEQIEKTCQAHSTSEHRVQPVNYNSPQQIVVAGHASAVKKFCEAIESEGGRTVPLAVSAPFHSDLMSPAKAAMRPFIEESEFITNGNQIIPNLTAEITVAYSNEHLLEQIDHPVKWLQSMEAAASAGVTAYLEIGPGKVLSGLAKRCVDRKAKTAQTDSWDAALELLRS